jgi:PIN domain nuclease of toxin-antitoxin system
LDLLLDTNVLVWVSTGDKRLTLPARTALFDEFNACFVSAATCWEFVELNALGRFGANLDFASIVERLSAKILPLPADIWQMSSVLPQFHRDPVDRMVIAHALHADMTLISSDSTMRSYAVKSIW